MEWRDIRHSFSQFGEDLLVQQLLPGDQGTYLDIGANHPVRFSNTYHLYRFRGWRGVLVEPNPSLAQLCRSRRPEDVVIQAAIGPVDGVALIEINPEHTLSRILKNSTETLHPALETPVFSLRRLFHQHPGLLEMDFLNIDCEGMDLEILASHPWDLCRPRVICAESTAPEENRLMGLLARQGYQLEARCGHSRIFALERTTQ